MTSSVVYFPSSCKISGHSEKTTEPKSVQRLVIRRHDCKNEQLSDQESERLFQGSASEKNSTKIMVIKELVDDDDSSVAGKRMMSPRRLGLQKKMKLSEDCNTVMTESFENFCEMHKKIRQLNDTRPPSDGKVSKPQPQPKADRGLRGPQRPMTAGKLSDIAATKYPDSIFKVYIAEADTTLKKKRVIPIDLRSDMRPKTPPKSTKLTTCRVLVGPPQRYDRCQEIANLESALRHRTEIQTRKTKHSVPPQSTQHENCSIKAAGESSGESFHIPKRITLLTEVSLTKEQEEKRLKDRAMMKKRTMDSVKKAFPSPHVEEGNQETKVQEELFETRDEQSCGEVPISPQQLNQCSVSKSSLKSVGSFTSCRNNLSPKRSVTWGHEITIAPVKEESESSGPKKVNVTRNQTGHLSKTGKVLTKNQRRSRSASETRNYDKFFKSATRTSNRKEKCRPIHDCRKVHAKVQQHGANTFKSSHRVSKCLYKVDEAGKRNPGSECNRAQKTKHRHCYSSDSDQGRHKPRYGNSKRSNPMREGFSKKSLRDRHNKCCCMSVQKNEFDSGSRMKKRDQIKTKNKHRCSKVVRDNRSGRERKPLYNEDTDFRNQISAIKRKHHNTAMSDDSDDNRNDSDNFLARKRESEEGSEIRRRGRSTPSLALKSNVESNSFGNSDSELCLVKHKAEANPRPHTSMVHLRTGAKSDLEDDKPLRRIFGTPKKSDKKKLEPTISKSESNSSQNNKREILKDIPEDTGLEKRPIVSYPVPNPVIVKRLSVTEVPGKSKKSQVTEDKKIDKPFQKSLHSSQTIAPCENVNVNTNICCPIDNKMNLDRSYLLVESYNVLTDVGHRDTSVSSSKSLTLEASNSLQLTREPPMLNLPYEECSVNSDEQLNDTSQGIHTLTTTEEEHSGVKIIEHPSKNAERFQTQTNADDTTFDENENQCDFKALHNKGQNTINCTNTRASAITRAHTNSNLSSLNDKKEIFQQPNENKGNITQNSIEKKCEAPQQPKIIEDRKKHLKKMLSKTKQSGPSAVTNQILEKWNMTQKSINARKEKILASRRETPDEKKIIQVSDCSDREKSSSDADITAESVEPHAESFVEHNVDPLSQLPEEVESNNDEMLKQQNIEVCEAGYSIDENFNRDYFQDIIALPGARQPQPYSTTSVLNNPSHESNLSEDNLIRQLKDSTLEKSLPTTNLLELEDKQLEHKSNVEHSEESFPTITTPKIEEKKELSEREVNSNPIRCTPSCLFDRRSNENFSMSPNSILDGGTGIVNVRTVGPRFGAIFFTPLRNLSVEALHSDESDTAFLQNSSYSTRQNTSNIPASSNHTVITTASRSPVSFRSTTRSRTLSRSRDRSTSGRSHTSSSGPRSVRLLERPPSRKPHMIESSDDDSDQDYLIGVEPSPMNIHADQLRSTNCAEPQKKPPPRMYSTLKDTPHSTQEYIKSAMRDMQVEDTNYPYGNNGPLPRDEDSIEKPSSRPQSRSSNPRCNIPRMSPGSIRILHEKVTGSSPERSGRRMKVRKECNLDERESSPNSWIQSTRVHEFRYDPDCSTGERNLKLNKNFSPVSSNNKPPFRYCSSINKSGEEWLSAKVKSKPHRNIPNYLPPWDRVDLKPPESALQERALHEKRLGIVSRVTAGHMEAPKPSNSPKPTRCPMSKSRQTNGDSVPVGTPVGGRTPILSRTPNQTPVGKRAPAKNRTPTAGPPRTPLGSRPVSSGTPQSPPGTVNKSILQVPKHKRSLLKSSSICESEEWLTAAYEEMGSSGVEGSGDSIEVERSATEEGEYSPESLPTDQEFVSAQEEFQSLSSIEYMPASTTSEGETLFSEETDYSFSSHCSLCQMEQKSKRTTSVELNVASSKRNVPTMISVSVQV